MNEKENKDGLRRYVIMGMCKPSGGIENVIGRLGDLKRWGKPNSRYDLHNERGEHIQSRWYGPNGAVIHNRDYNHGGKIHDHEWVFDDQKGPIRSKGHIFIQRAYPALPEI